MKLFVYGTLKKGYGNNHLLSSSKFVRKDITLEKFILLSPSFPVAVEQENEEGGYIALPVAGEVWEVDEGTLARTDRLEGHPHWYCRRLVKTLGGDECWMYTQDKRPSGPLSDVIDNTYTWRY